MSRAATTALVSLLLAPAAPLHGQPVADGELGEEIVFETDASGRVTGFRQHGNLSPRIR